MSQSNVKKVLPLEVTRSLSTDMILPGNTINVQILVTNTTQHPIESLYITEGDIQPAHEVELFPVTEIDSMQFIHQGITPPTKQHSFQYSITLHPYSTCEHVSIGDMQVSFSVNRLPTQMTVPGATITVESIPIEELEISEGYYSCPNCAEHLELDTVLCTRCGFEINQETLHKIWSNHTGHMNLIEEELIQRDKKQEIQMDEMVKSEEIPDQVEEKPVQAELPDQMEIIYLKQAAQSFQEDNCEECLLNLKIAVQIIKKTHPTELQSSNGVVEKLLTNIVKYDGKSVSKRTAATSLKFIINFIKSLKTAASE
ncbi:hypothetical protein [Candidatus Borrarchaeum sp.]|uniref:hypothetical protein n=1 Tax=Candidatus Borrarchaeum sp. TaxID=2846742 RepID=UPI002580766E|nr:hypothetical protein [Candidatus Borrarchaeum sp.]